MNHVTAAVVVGTLFVSSGVSAQAQKCSAGIVAKIRALNNRAYTDCLNYRYDGAKALLEAAVALAASNRCGETLESARTHLFLGVVEYAGFKNRKGAKAAWGRALAVWPNAVVPPKLATPAMNRFFKQVKQKRLRPAPPVTRTPPRARPGKVPRGWTPVRPGASPPVKPARPAAPPAPGGTTSWKYRRMPDNPALYGLGSPLAWGDYRKGKRLKNIGTIMTVVGAVLSVAGMGVGLGLLAKKKYTEGGIVLGAVMGTGSLVAGIGAGIMSHGSSKMKEAGLMIFKTRGPRVSGVSVSVGPAAAAVRGSF